MNKRHLLIDCDTGTDDAIALIATLGNQGEMLEVVGISSVNGNVEEQYTSENNLRLLSYLGYSVPVSRGAKEPIFKRGNYYSDVHGSHGLFGINLPTCTESTFSKLNAPEFILAMAKKYEDFEILAIGPLTNIAITLCLYPSIKERIKHLWIMGGAIEGGNVSDDAEFNIWVDPYAADKVIHSEIPMHIVGLDVTERACITKKDAVEIKQVGSPASELVAEILEKMFQRHEEGGEDALMHDALAASAIFCPECLTFREASLEIDVSDSFRSGKTIYSFSEKSSAPRVQVATDLDLPKFKEWLKSSVEGCGNQERNYKRNGSV